LIAAEKKIYEYETYYEQPLEENIQHEPLSKVYRKRNIIQNTIPIILLLFGFSVCLLLVSRFATVSINNLDIIKTKNDLALEQKKTEDLKVNLLMAENLDNIQEIARTKLGMAYPNSTQIQYIKIPIDVKIAAKDTQKTKLVKDSILDKIYHLLD